MFIGHFALGFAAKRVVPRTSLAALFAAAQFPDLLWPLFVAAGIEQARIQPENSPFLRLDFVSYPYSHSLMFSVVWAFVFAWLYRLTVGDGRVFRVLIALVVSHWVLDVGTHTPDMPLYPGGPKLGGGLWNSTAATIAVEAAMYAGGVWIYMRATRARDAVGRWGVAALAALVPVFYVASLPSAPPSVAAIYMSAIGGSVLILAWAWWADRHREATVGGQAGSNLR